MVFGYLEGAKWCCLMWFTSWPIYALCEQINKIYFVVSIGFSIVKHDDIKKFRLGKKKLY